MHNIDMTKFLNWILCFPILGSRVKFLKNPVYFNNICWKLRSFFILDNVRRTLPYPPRWNGRVSLWGRGGEDMATRRLCLHYCEILHMLQSNILYILHDSVLNSYKFLEKRSLVSPETLAPHKQRNNNNNNNKNKQANKQESKQTNKQTGEQPN